MALIDRRLPDGDGLSLITTAKEASPETSVIILVALDEINEVVLSLCAAADDFLAKPFHGQEFVARIRSALRKREKEHRELYKIGDLTFDCALREVLVGGKPVALDRREIALLAALIERAGRVIAREALILRIYGENADVQQHTLDTLVWRLRRRLSEAGASVSIHVSRGVGYFLRERAKEHQ